MDVLLSFTKINRSIMTNNKQQTAVEWFANQAYELFEQYSEGKFDRITLNKLMLQATGQAKEMEVMGKEMSYADGYAEGYKRALDYMNMSIKNAIETK
jgi:hypothetical protein